MLGSHADAYLEKWNSVLFVGEKWNLDYLEGWVNFGMNCATCLVKYMRRVFWKCSLNFVLTYFAFWLNIVLQHKLSYCLHILASWQIVFLEDNARIIWFALQNTGLMCSRLKFLTVQFVTLFLNQTRKHETFIKHNF